MKLFYLLVLTLLIGCGATMQETFDEDLESIYGHKRGVFSYSNKGIGLYAGEENFEDGMRQASEFCDWLTPKIVDASEKVSSGIMSLPVQNTAYHSGNIGGVNYSGNTTYTSYQSIPYSSKTTYVHFACPDKDVKTKSYFLYVSQKTSEPNCLEYGRHLSPGEERIMALAKDSSSLNCLKSQGWLRYFDTLSKQNETLFIGEKGLKKCTELSKKMIDEMITSDKSNLYLLKNLKCE